MAHSVLATLFLPPVFCATILKPHDPGKSEGDGPLARFFRWFNDKFDRGTRKYEGGVRRTANSCKRSGFVYLMIVAAMGLIFMRMPGGFLPEADQGTMFALVQAPPGGTFPRTQKALDVVRHHFLKHEKAAVNSVFTVSGFSFNGQAGVHQADRKSKRMNSSH